MNGHLFSRVKADVVRNTANVTPRQIPKQVNGAGAGKLPGSCLVKPRELSVEKKRKKTFAGPIRHL